MELKDAILDRNSIRSFHNTPIKKDVLEQVLQLATMWSLPVRTSTPSPCGMDLIHPYKYQRHFKEISLAESDFCKTDFLFFDAKFCNYFIRGTHAYADVHGIQHPWKPAHPSDKLPLRYMYRLLHP